LSRVHGLVEQVDEYYKKYEFHSIYHLVVKFMTLELSNQYLNFIKDRIYAESAHSHLRRSAQTCLYFILHSMVRLLAPILSFTMEEVWDYLEHRDVHSVHLSLFIHKDPKFYESFKKWKQPELEKNIEMLSFYKDEVYKKINDLRPKQKGDKLEGQIGSSEEAEVYFTVTTQEDYEILIKYQSILSEYWVVSKVHIFYGSSFMINVMPSQYPKCDRCWRYQENSFDKQNSFLCARCFDVIESMENL
jgi:isoleucyl-tRNA synthetase